MLPLKKCNRCKKELQLDSFKKRKNNDFYNCCKKCNTQIAINKKKRYDKHMIIETHDEKLQKCSQCFLIKNKKEFKQNKNGTTKRCYLCLDKNKERELKRKENVLSLNKKKCSKCYVIKELNFFEKTKKGIQKQCKDCCTKYKDLQRKNKTKKILLISLNVNEKQCTRCFEIKHNDCFKTLKYKHCIVCNEKHQKYLENNRCEHGCLNKSACVRCLGGSICEHNIKKCECKDCDFHGYLYSKVRKRLSLAIKKSKTKRTMEYIGCDIITFKQHIEQKFIDGMNWENYGKIWHIDHIIPIKYNNPSLTEVIERLHYLNTQPLWATENIIKGNRYIG